MAMRRTKMYTKGCFWIKEKNSQRYEPQSTENWYLDLWAWNGSWQIINKPFFFLTWMEKISFLVKLFSKTISTECLSLSLDHYKKHFDLTCTAWMWGGGGWILSHCHHNPHCKDPTFRFVDQYQYLGNFPPTPPLAQQQSIDNKLGSMLG